MEHILIISGSEKAAEQLLSLLSAAGHSKITTITSGSEARRLVNETEFDFILINTPLPDEFGHDLAAVLSLKANATVFLLVKNEIADEVADKVEPSGVFVIPKPINRAFFYQALRLAAASRRRLLGLRKENIQLQTKIEEIRMVDRAKCARSQYLNMTEKQAHRYIEKQAMDMRTTKMDIAQGILKTYES